MTEGAPPSPAALVGLMPAGWTNVTELADAFTRALEAVDPEDAKGRAAVVAFRALALCDLQQPEPALIDAQAAKAADPHLPQAHQAAVVALLALGRLSEAVAAGVHGVRTCPRDGPYYGSLNAAFTSAVRAWLRATAGRGWEALRCHRSLHPPPSSDTAAGAPLLSPQTHDPPADHTAMDTEAAAPGDSQDAPSPVGDNTPKRSPSSEEPVSGGASRRKKVRTADSEKWGPLGCDWADARPTAFSLCTCRHCGLLLHFPCTLPCGHSVCLSCREAIERLEPAASRRCPMCGVSLRPVDLQRGICRQLRDLVTAVFEAEDAVMETVRAPGDVPLDRLASLVASAPTDPTRALLHCRIATQLAADDPATALQHVAAAQALESRFHQSYDLEHRIHATVGRPAAALRALVKGAICSRPVRACDGPDGFADRATALLGDGSVGPDQLAACLRVLDAPLACDQPPAAASTTSDMEVIHLPVACPRVRHRFDRAGCLSKLECPICLNIFCDPITAHCGHTFCRNCLSRTLDHDNHCPFCRAVMPPYLSHQHKTNHSLQALIELHFPAELQERLDQLQGEQQMDNMDEFPIFVCMVALPGSSYPLHIFEPRYRLMIRRAWESTKRIGMCVHTHQGFASTGCVLEITALTMLPDGRCTLESHGGRRFRVLERGMKDGYNVGKIEWFDDDAEQEAAMNADGSTDRLVAEVKGRLAALGPLIIVRAAAQIGPLPQDDTLAGFWYGRFLSSDDQGFLLQFLSMQTNRQRYEVLHAILSGAD